MTRSVLAPNASAMTIDGTRTFLVGRGRVAVIDPGPDSDEHLDAVARAIGDGVVTAVLVTHAHPDHDEGARAMSERLGAPLRSAIAGNLRDGDRIETDAGPLVALATPGHAPDHFAFHAPDHGAVFCGDLMMGGLDTALVAAPEGDLTDYLASLERIRALRPRVIHPAHGPDFDDPDAAIDAYVRHRRERVEQVLDALRAVGAGGAAGEADGVADEDRGGAGAPPRPVDAATLADAVYGRDLHPTLLDFTRRTIVAYLEHLERSARVRRVGGGWETVK